MVFAFDDERKNEIGELPVCSSTINPGIYAAISPERGCNKSTAKEFAFERIANQLLESILFLGKLTCAKTFPLYWIKRIAKITDIAHCDALIIA